MISKKIGSFINNCYWDYKQMKEKGVHFQGEPVEQFYGTEVIFRNLYGNRFNLIQVAPRPYIE